MSDKQALCIHIDQAPWHLTSETPVAPLMKSLPMAFFTNALTTLQPRATCETDPSLLQLLPYYTLQRANGDFFNYTRGTAGTEGRLHDLLSLGLGGHVDSRPPMGMHLYEHLQNEGAREHKEETGVDIPHKLEMTHYLFDPDVPLDLEPGKVPVGLVHLGLWGMVYATDEVQEAEQGIIDKGRWSSLEALSHQDVFQNLEPWSKLVVQHLFAAKYGRQIHTS